MADARANASYVLDWLRTSQAPPNIIGLQARAVEALGGYMDAHDRTGGVIPRAGADRPLTDTQERALIALSELPDHGERGWHRASEIRVGTGPSSRFAPATWFALKRLGLVETHEASVTPLEVKITEAGTAMLNSMGD